MGCAEFQELLVEYAELVGDSRARVDAHLAECSGCREFLEALQTVDAALAAQFGDCETSAEFATAVRRRVGRETAMRRPSFIPEVLDFVGWGAIVALIALLAWWVSPLIPVWSTTDALSLNTALAAGGAFVLVAFVIGLRSLADLKH
jgi:predicted anti-sigma-YlaC factor YlaD